MLRGQAVWDFNGEAAISSNVVPKPTKGSTLAVWVCAVESRHGSGAVVDLPYGAFIAIVPETTSSLRANTDTITDFDRLDSGANTDGFSDNFMSNTAG